MYKIVTAEFPFTESRRKKTRPVLLLSEAYGRYKIVVAAYITSKIKEILKSDVELKKSDKNGLILNSVIRLHKLESILSSAVKGELGELTADEGKEVRRKLKMIFGL